MSFDIAYVKNANLDPLVKEVLVKFLQDAGLDQSTNATNIGAVNAPAAGTTTVAISRSGSFVRLDFTLTAAQISVTDAAASGSYGTLKLFDFVQGGIVFLGCRQNYTAFAEGAALTTAAGDATFEIGVGTTAIAAAADGTLGNGVNENVGQAVALTNVAGTSAGTIFDYPRAAIDGTSTALDLNLNWSGTAATIDANSTIAVTGTITVLCALLGDD